MTNLNAHNEDWNWTDIGPETISALKNTLKAGDHLVGDRSDFHTAKFSRWDQDEIIATDGRILNADTIRKITSLNAIKHKQQLDREFQFMEDVAESLDITVRDLIREIQTGDVRRVIPLFLNYSEVAR